MAADRGVCLAEVINISGDHLPDISASSTTNVTVLFTTADDAAVYFASRFRRGLFICRYWLTLSFTGTILNFLLNSVVPYAGYGSKVPSESSTAHAHVVVGDAHDFYLRDPANMAKFVGTVSLQPKV